MQFWDLPGLEVPPEVRLKVTPAGCSTHLSVQLYLVKGGRRRNYEKELKSLDEEHNACRTEKKSRM